MKISEVSTMASSSYLVVLFCATAGKNGDELGVDEEQVVLFVYLLYDVPNNKVIAVQQHYVRPTPSELSETVITEECRLETGLDEEVVKNAHPLDHALDEFDRFLVSKGVHPEHGGKSFCLLTDGPTHIRQVLHPECSNKNVTIPPYFFSYYDIRKEFVKFYKAENIVNIKSMLDYLGTQEDQSVDYGIRKCQDLAAIIHRLLVDGHVFDESEIVNERLEPGICSKSDVVDDEVVVRARGLPWQSSDQDIARFFKGLNIAKGGVALCLSPQGRRNGEALVRFTNQEMRDLAIRRHKHHIGQRYIEVYKATGKDFLNVAGGSNTEAQAFLSRGGEVIIRMRGLPFTATTQQVMEFFAREPTTCEVLDGEEGILFVHYPDGRSTGDAFVLMSTEEEADKALKKHRDIMGTRYIELFKSTTAEVQQVLNRSMDPRNPEPQENQVALPPLIAQLPPQAALPYIPQNLITSGHKRDCIRLRNLPGGSQVTDILSFLGEFSQFILYQGVHMVYSAQGEASGEAFIQMSSEEAAQITAINRNRRQIIYAGKKRVIEVIQCSGEDMNLVLTHGITSPTLSPVTPIAHQAAIPAISHASLVQRQLISPGTTALLPSLPSHANPLATSAFQMTQFPQPMYGAPFQQGLSPFMTAGARPGMFPQIIYWYQSPQLSPTQTLYTNTPASPPMVVMRGLPFNVSLQDILNFFQGFPEVTPESVQVQYTPEGVPSGDVAIVFMSRAEAERAVNEKNRQLVGNRIVELFLAS
ncbi:epithelial splicing regulatory protein 1-like isoform X2 [Mya arenaria]|uniref:epithelial splicing regulatory protein 1-like isoform X2 n=1 Tax=Mya arenaria TaxID=6604 RepID=UPI0022E84483|nr:epithelial splicing regulatory protein 1-like isoform X2 [Mya arenaria]